MKNLFNNKKTLLWQSLYLAVVSLICLVVACSFTQRAKGSEQKPPNPSTLVYDSNEAQIEAYIANTARTPKFNLEPVLTKTKKSVATRETNTWFRAKNGQPKAIAVIIHGLNGKPSAMDTIAKFLADAGVESLRVGLSGHQNNLDVLKFVSEASWQNEVIDAYCLAKQRANALGVPIYFFGHSMGALLNLNAMAKHPKLVSYDKMVFFAPAISLRWYCYFVKLAFLLGNERVFHFSRFNPDGYRANQGIAIAAYRALIESLSSLRMAGFSNLNIPSLVIIDPRDELVSPWGIRTLMKKEELTRWKILEIDNRRSTMRHPLHHLTIDQKSAGSNQWKQIEETILDYLDLKKATRRKQAERALKSQLLRTNAISKAAYELDSGKDLPL